MQTKLRTAGLIIVASLLWISPVFGASQRAPQHEAAKRPRLKYIGTASWYGKKHQGRKMANGQRFDRAKLTAASWYFPLGTTLRVVNVNNGESVVVQVTDRGPAQHLHRLVDLSEGAARRLGYVDAGITQVFLYPVATFETESSTFDSSLNASAARASDNSAGDVTTASPM